VGIPIVSIGHPGGEQQPLTLFAYTLLYAAYYFFSLSILIFLLFRSWAQKHLFAQLCVFLVALAMILISIFNK
jgi:hypothetical protein